MFPSQIATSNFTVQLIKALLERNFIQTLPFLSQTSFQSMFHRISQLLVFFRNPFNSAPTFPNQSQWNASGENEFDIASTSSIASAANPAPKVNNHQKTAERMAEDESNYAFYGLDKANLIAKFLFS